MWIPSERMRYTAEKPRRGALTERSRARPSGGNPEGEQDRRRGLLLGSAPDGGEEERKTGECRS